MENHLVANEETIKILAEIDGCVNIFGRDEKYPKWERRLLEEWWKNYILPQHGKNGPIGLYLMII